MALTDGKGLFSGNKSNKHQVDKEGLKQLTVEKLAQGLQSNPSNEMAGLEGRAQLLIRLGETLAEKREFFGEDGRPGNMLGGLPGADTLGLANAMQITSSPTPRHRPPASSLSRYRCFGTY